MTRCVKNNISPSFHAGCLLASRCDPSLSSRQTQPYAPTDSPVAIGRFTRPRRVLRESGSANRKRRSSRGPGRTHWGVDISHTRNMPPLKGTGLASSIPPASALAGHLGRGRHGTRCDGRGGPAASTSSSAERLRVCGGRVLRGLPPPAPRSPRGTGWVCFDTGTRLGAQRQQQGTHRNHLELPCLSRAQHRGDP